MVNFLNSVFSILQTIPTSMAHTVYSSSLEQIIYETCLTWFLIGGKQQYKVHASSHSFGGGAWTCCPEEQPVFKPNSFVIFL